MEIEWFFIGTAAFLCLILTILIFIWAFQAPSSKKIKSPRVDLEQIKKQITSGSTKKKQKEFYNSQVEDF